ncbi:MAG: hypothetical protein ACI9R7_001657, partial [Lysobacterales bacterium]
MSSFSGFPKDLFKFFSELKQNNDRDWFNENKPRYIASVLTPMGAFIEAIAPGLKKISPYYVADPR